MREMERTTDAMLIRRADASSGVGRRALTVSRAVVRGGPRKANLVAASLDVEASSSAPGGGQVMWHVDARQAVR